jgi:exodeoxyribonuclease V alpha subunit
LILLGDKDQLSSVEAGGVMADLCDSAADANYSDETLNWLTNHNITDMVSFQGNGHCLAQQTVMLRHNWRFKDSPGITALADAINSGDTNAAQDSWQHPDLAKVSINHADDSQLEEFCSQHYAHYLKHLRDNRPGQCTPEANSQWAKGTLQSLGNFQLLTPLREGPLGVIQLNARIEKAIQQSGLIENTGRWYEGRPVMMTENRYDLGLMNGDVGITLSIDTEDDSLPEAPKQQLAVAFVQANGAILFVPCARLHHVQTVFAMTVHKSQGSEFKHVALALPDQSPSLNRELLYTAVTRARSRFTLIMNTSSDAIERAINTPSQRASGLGLRLQEKRS